MNEFPSLPPRSSGALSTPLYNKVSTGSSGDGDYLQVAVHVNNAAIGIESANECREWKKRLCIPWRNPFPLSIDASKLLISREGCCVHGSNAFDDAAVEEDIASDFL